jgi:hypothetical protein
MEASIGNDSIQLEGLKYCVGKAGSITFGRACSATAARKIRCH